MNLTQEGHTLVVDLFGEGPVDKGKFSLNTLRGLPQRRFDKTNGVWVLPLTRENWEALQSDSALAELLELEGIEEPTRSSYSLTRYKNLLALQVPPSQDNIAKCRAIPEQRMWNPELEAWVFRVTPQNVQYVRTHWPQLVADDAAAKLIQQVLREREPPKSENRQPHGVKPEATDITDYKFKTKPFKHQSKAFALSRDAESFALFMEQGTGKTKVVIDTAAWLHINGKITGLLVICPNAVKSNWVRDEIPTHMPDYVDVLAVEWKSTMGKEDQAKLAEALGPVQKGRLAVLVMNVEAFSSKKGQEVATKFVSRHTCLTAVDESTRIKTPGAKRTKSILKIGRLSKYRRILTGAPVTQGPLDLFAQFKFLDDRILGFSSFYSFRNHFAVLGGFKGKQVVAYANLDELQALIDPHSFRVTKDECLDLPAKIFQKQTVELTPEQKRLYREMKDNMLTEFGGANASVTEVIVQMLRLQQIVGGFLPIQDEDTGDYHARAIPGGNPKLNALLDIAEDVQGKVIIWARFRAEIDLIARALREAYGPASVVEFHGGISEDSRTEARKRFQDPKDAARFFVGQTETGGIGLTLTQARTVVYYSNSFSLESRLQSEDRAHRIGQTQHVTYIDLVASGTLDEHLLKTLRSKKSLANTITGDAWFDWV